MSDRLAEEQAGNPYGDNPKPCDRCRAFAARLDTGLCEWCTAEPSMCQCYLCLDRRARELAALRTRPPWQGPLPPPIEAPKAASDANRPRAVQDLPRRAVPGRRHRMRRLLAGPHRETARPYRRNSRKAPGPMTIRRQPTAVELDDMLAKLTPELLAQIRPHFPVPGAYVDQLRAAQAESIAAVEAAENGTARYHPSAGIDDWLRLALLDTLIAWTAGTAKTCLHMPDWRRPEPVWSAAWKPGLVVCSRCLYLLEVASAQIDRTCDCCGHVTAGVDAGDPIYPTTVWFGQLAYSAGACHNCRPATAATSK